MSEPTAPAATSATDAVQARDEAARAVLRGLPRVDVGADPRWQVRIYDPGDAADVQALAALVAATPDLRVIDTIEAQIRDLLRTRVAGRATSTASFAAMRAALLADGDAPIHQDGRLADAPLDATDGWGRWVHRPWAGTLVHVLPPALFAELRLDRNRLRIRTAEQAALRGRCVAVAGLSVGQAIAVCLAQEGVAGSFRLADPDQLDLSNLNRLRAGVHELGVSKLALAARAILDIDPYLEVAGLADGVSLAEPDALLLRADGRPVDLLVEECDDLPLKVALRLRARQLGVPVVMATSEGGLLDIERFDLEPERPIFHGLATGIDLEALVDGDDDARAAFVLAVLGRDVLSARTAASLVELRQSVTSWPQLASAVALGAAQVTEVARQIFTGGARVSGRLRVDLSAGPGTRAAGPLPAPPRAPGPVAAAVEGLDADDLPDEAGWRRLASACTQELSAEALQALCDAAAMAPSGGNAQPWRLRWRGSDVEILDRIEAPVPGMDPARVSVAMAAGSVAESIAIAASALGWSAEIRPGSALQPDRALCTVSLRPGGEAADPLLPWLGARCTNRRLQPAGAPTGLSADEREALAEAARALGGAIWLAEDDAARARWGAVAGSADRLRFLHQPWLQELASEVRFDPAPVEGLDVRSLEMSAASRAILPMLLDAAVMAEVAAVDGGDGLRKPARDAFAASSAIALLTLPATSMAEGGVVPTLVSAGRLLQRVWLRATALGLAVHPWGSALFLRNVARQRGPSGLPGGGRLAPNLDAALDRLADEVEALLPAGTMPTMLMRLSRCPPPTARARRRRIDPGADASAGAPDGLT